MLLAGLEPRSLAPADWIAVAHVVVTEQGERVEAIDEWLSTRFPWSPAPVVDLQAWAEDPAWLAQQAAMMAQLGTP